LKGANIDTIGKIYDVHRATVARWIVNTERQLTDHVKRHFRDQLGITGSECESLARGLKSRLDLCLDSML
jgi:RNA polymerase sigma-70 factor (ECF subfamily)